jgi:hypothetical protein
MVQVVQCLPIKCEALSSNPITKKKPDLFYDPAYHLSILENVPCVLENNVYSADGVIQVFYILTNFLYLFYQLLKEKCQTSQLHL